MKKILMGATLALLSLTASAQDPLQSQKLQIVKKIYKNGGDMGVLLNYASRDLKSVFDEDERNTPEGEMGCIDYDVTIQGQDSNPKEIIRSLKTSVTSNGNVLVTFKNGQRMKLIYVMKCHNGRCLVDDVLEKGKSFKQQVRQCIRG
ncbi:hypothetical protein LNQ82_06005 [Conchiformibius steedae DSM 2580]|uniref:DUF3828 domain-containing protein n=1 Tax=Conchiformibius steedae DSM 2580 TaxID=1121352 RepID=A0AAE9HSB4_9NEIS|nr:hypothetical protein [Conchiformibius steedae]QMT34013.1 hypothetical protein H3L98_03085 [Conchiformibius steedae]URD66784.1 hypothetical protein LNQ82_06005 [Conchiformibius steedae DSM 2580]